MSKTTDDSKVESGLVGGNKSAAEHHDGGHHIQITNTKFKAHLKCDYCGRTRHTRDTCWKLNPEKRFSRNKEHSRANNVSSSRSFTKEQLDQLVALLKPQLASSGNSSGLLAQAGGEMQDMGHKNPTRELQVYHRRKTAPSTSVPDIQHTDDQPHSPGTEMKEARRKVELQEVEVLVKLEVAQGFLDRVAQKEREMGLLDLKNMDVALEGKECADKLQCN
ncbi:hypothetical protein LINPERPRIM_LOCUS40477 [Linum perenne]